MKNGIIITGASRGIGFETAKSIALKHTDYDVVVMIARKSDDFDSAVRFVNDISVKSEVLAIEADLSDLSKVDDIFDELDSAGIQVIAVINNAGFTKPASINETKLADFEMTFRVNLFSPFLIVQAAVHRSHPLKKVVNIASTAGMTGRAGWLTYSASKAAMINMSEVLRDELRPYGTDVICLSPGRCATDLRKKLAPDEDPMTIMQPSQVADIIMLMIGDSGKLLMAQNLIVRT